MQGETERGQHFPQQVATFLALIEHSNSRGCVSGNSCARGKRGGWVRLVSDTGTVIENANSDPCPGTECTVNSPPISST